MIKINKLWNDSTSDVKTLSQFVYSSIKDKYLSNFDEVASQTTEFHNVECISDTNENTIS